VLASLLQQLGFLALIAGLLPLIAGVMLAAARRPAAEVVLIGTAWLEGLALWTVAVTGMSAVFGPLGGLGSVIVSGLAIGAAWAKGWHDRGLLACLLLVPLALIFVPGPRTSQQWTFWLMWTASILPIHALGRWAGKVAVR
jgi:hypothetical protein